jgi:hypothetical protein
MPSMPIDKGSAIFLTSSRCVCTSQQVWCRVSSGAPLSSNCPPGSRLMLQPCFASAIGLPFSSTGCQPNLAAMPSSSALMPRGPS